MKKLDAKIEDELRPEYDLKSLRVRKLGPGRESFGDLVQLEPGVIEVVSDAESVNEGLRSESLVKLKKVDNG